MRKRLPPVVFILLLIFLLLMLGIACVCISDHPVQPIERALGAITAAPPVMEIWTLMVVLMFVSAVLIRPRTVASRASPATLQRFLF